MRNPSPLDDLLSTADRALRAVFAPAVAARPTPEPGPVRGSVQPEATPEGLSEAEKRHAAALMRVNHAGEVAAQALYHGQALFARTPEARAMLMRAAREEADHLAWCQQRIGELGGRPSLLNPLWYAGSFAMGAAAAALGDRISMGFLAETERQVESHIDDHLARLPASDVRSRAILEQMKRDEIAHGQSAKQAGAAEFPPPVRKAMHNTSRVMTLTSYWI